jgi:rare lipoprotein A
MTARHLILILAFFVASCATPPPPAPPAPAPESATFHQTGVASWYGKDHQGLVTANGERYDMNAMTAAHRDLPFHTIARVTSVATGKSVKVRINDRGPMVKGRVIDLSSAAGSAIGMGDSGLMTVRIEVFASDQSRQK